MRQKVVILPTVHTQKRLVCKFSTSTIGFSWHVLHISFFRGPVMFFFFGKCTHKVHRIIMRLHSNMNIKLDFVPIKCSSVRILFFWPPPSLVDIWRPAGLDHHVSMVHNGVYVYLQENPQWQPSTVPQRDTIEIDTT